MLDLVYSRVSTDEQNSEYKTSVPDQEKRGIDYLRNLGYKNIQTFREDFSGFKFERPELDKIKSLIKQGKVRSLVFLRVDRLTRQTGHLEELRDGYFIPYNVEVYSVDDLGKWLWTPNHIFLQNTLVNFSNFWGKLAVSLMKQGKRNRVLSGSTLAFGHAPYGYREVRTKEKNYFEPDELEAGIIEMLYTLYVEDDMSLAAISRKLNAEKVPTYSQLRGNHFRRHNGDKAEMNDSHKWYGSTVRQMLIDTTYKGVWKYGKDSDNPIEVDVLPIVDEDIWNNAQKKLSYNKKHESGRRTKYKVLMARRLTCACGYKMSIIAKQQGRYKYLRCPASVKNGEIYNPDCPSQTLKTELVDGTAFYWLYNVLSDQNKLKSRLEAYIQEQKETVQPTLDRIKNIDQILERKQKKHRAMLNSFWKLPELAQEVTAREMEALEKGIKEQMAEKDRLKDSLRKFETTMKLYKDYTGEELDHDFPPISIMVQDNDDPVIREAGKEFNKAMPIPYWWTEDMDDNRETLTFEDKLRYVKQFDLRGQLVIEDGTQKLFVSCKLGLSALLELCDTSKSHP